MDLIKALSSVEGMNCNSLASRAEDTKPSRALLLVWDSGCWTR